MAGRIYYEENFKSLVKSLDDLGSKTAKTGKTGVEAEKAVQKEVQEHIRRIADLISKRERLNQLLKEQKNTVKSAAKDVASQQKTLADFTGLEQTKPGIYKEKATQDAIAASTLALFQAEDKLNKTRKESLGQQKKTLTARENINNKINEQRQSIYSLTKAKAEENKEWLTFGKRLDIAIKKIITYRIAFGIYREATEAIRESVRETISLNDSFQDLRKVLTASESDFDNLRKQAFKMGIVFGRTAGEVADTFFVFAQQGLNMNEILDRTYATLLLTASASFSTAEAVEALTSVVEVFPEFLDNVTAAVDKWVAVQATAPVATADLANAMKETGLAAAELGINLDELNGMVSAINETSRKSGKAIGHSLKTVFARVPRQESVNAFKALGIAVQSTQKDFRPFTDILIDLKDKWSSLTDVQQKNIAQVVGGVRRYNDFLALIKNFDRFVNATVTSMLSQGNATDKATEDLKKYSRQLQSAKTQVSEFSTAFTESTLIPTMLFFTRQAAIMANTIKENVGLFKPLAMVVGGAVAAIGIGAVVISGYNSVATAAAFKTGLLAKRYELLGRSAATAGVGVRILNVALNPYIGILTAILPLMAIYAIAAIKSKKSNEELTKSIEGEADALDKLNKLRERSNKLLLTETQIKLAEPLVERQTYLMNLIDAVKRERERIEKEIAASKEEEEIIEIPSRIILAPSAGVPGMVFAPKLKVKISKEEIASAKKEAQKKIEEETRKAKIEAEAAIIAKLPEAEVIKILDKYSIEVNKITKDLQDLIATGSERFIPITLTKFLESAFELEAQLKNVNNVLINDEKTAKLLGKEFNLVTERFEAFSEIGEKIGQIGIDLKVNKEQIELLKKSAIYRSLDADEAGKQSQELTALIENENYLLTERDKLQKEFSRGFEPAKIAYENLLNKQKEINLQLERETASYDIQIEQQKLFGRGFGKLSSQRALDFNVVQQLLKEEEQILVLERDRTLNSIELKHRHDNLLNTSKSLVEQKKKEEEVEKTLINFSKERMLLNVKALEQIQKSVENIQLEVSSAFAGAFADIPGNIVEQKRKIKEIEVSKLETQKELADAQKANDQAAINQAKARLRELENDIKRLKPVWVDVFGSIGDIAVKRWGELFANSILFGNPAKLLAGGIIPASVLGAQKYYEAIVSASLIAAKEPGFTGETAIAPTGAIMGTFNIEGKRIEDKIGQLPSELSVTGDKIANKWQVAIESGGNLAAVALVRAFGVGTGEVSNALANFGGLLGAAGAKSLFGEVGGTLGNFLGPLGTIAGSLVGAGIGALFDKDIEPVYSTNTDALNRNTQAIENNNSLLSLQREFINAPSLYNPYPLYGTGNVSSGGPVNVTVNINGASNSTDTANAVVKAIDSAYGSSVKRTQTKFGRFGH